MVNFLKKLKIVTSVSITDISVLHNNLNLNLNTAVSTSVSASATSLADSTSNELSDYYDEDNLLLDFWNDLIVSKNNKTFPYRALSIASYNPRFHVNATLSIFEDYDRTVNKLNVKYLANPVNREKLKNQLEKSITFKFVEVF